MITCQYLFTYILDVDIFVLFIFLFSGGLGLFPRTSHVQHSCYPNTTRHTSKQQNIETLTLRTIRPIKKGECITVAHIDIYQTRGKRHSALGYSCTCERCVGSLQYVDEQMEAIKCTCGSLLLPNLDRTEYRCESSTCTLTKSSTDVNVLLDQLTTRFTTGRTQFLHRQYKECISTWDLLIKDIINIVGPYHWILPQIYAARGGVSVACKDYATAQT